MVSPIVGTMLLFKVLEDGGSGLNILYASTLDRRRSLGAAYAHAMRHSMRSS
jgi:hypothetical protein